ncbi:hypothetical protein QCA50_009856 [Cerrena zonata]|uniref:Indoleamine 2,3-dioxygenase n=1 Tax=Cerrena zonata TaxID=2478898 RepID=A0AAW0GCJ6_9APHY
MPELETGLLEDDAQYRRAYQVLTFLTHAYIWGVNEPTDKLPKQIANPLLKVSEYLRLPPLATYSGLCLWNFKEILPSETSDNEGSVLMKMEEMCDPHVFYFRIRPYLAGWKGMADVGLDKNGIYYGDESTPRSYAGGSNAQSSLIQFLDILLNVKHFSTGERPAPHEQQNLNKPTENSFMNEMKLYMPGKHQDFLAKLEKISNVRDYVLKNQDENPDLILSYDACLAMLKAFRDKHIQIVTRYVVLQAKKSSKLGSSSTLRSGLAKSKKKGVEEKGTGGTSLLPFLKQCRDETGDPAAGNWGKRILSDGVMRLKYSRPNAINED